MLSVQRSHQLCWLLLFIALTKAAEYYGPPKYGYQPPKYYGYDQRPHKKLQTGLASVLKSPDIFTIVAGDKRTTTETPIELHINLTLPENGIPPTKLNLGNVAGYLNQRPGGPKPTRHTVLVDIQNQNKPFKPIPVDVYQAGLPQGSLLPPDKAADCKRLISDSCKTKCSAIRRGCNPLCKNAPNCLATCDRASKTCATACDGVKDNELFKLMDGGKLGEQAKVVLLTKCLRHCNTNGLCISKCNDACKDKLVERGGESSRHSNQKQFFRQNPDQLSVQGLLESLPELNLADFSTGISQLLDIFENDSGTQALPFDIAALISQEEAAEGVLNADIQRSDDEDYPSDVAMDFF